MHELGRLMRLVKRVSMQVNDETLARWRRAPAWAGQQSGPAERDLATGSLLMLPDLRTHISKKGNRTPRPPRVQSTPLQSTTFRQTARSTLQSPLASRPSMMKNHQYLITLDYLTRSSPCSSDRPPAGDHEASLSVLTSITQLSVKGINNSSLELPGSPERIESRLSTATCLSFSEK